MEKRYKAHSNGTTASCFSASISTYSCTVESLEGPSAFSEDKTLTAETVIDKLEIFLNETNSTALQTYAKEDLLLYDDRVEGRNLSNFNFSNISQDIAALDKSVLEDITNNFALNITKQSCNG